MSEFSPEWYARQRERDVARYERIKSEGGERYEKRLEHARRQYWSQFNFGERQAKRRRAKLKALLLERSRRRAMERAS